MRIILTRHGETDYNVKGLIQGQYQSKLTKNGIKQTKALAEALKNKKIDAIYTSKLTRTIKTAEIVNKYHNLKINKQKELNERKFGAWQGKKGDLMQEKFGKNIQEDINFKPKGAETWSAVYKRTYGFLKKIIKKHKNQTILIVSHKGPIRLILTHLLKRPLKNHWKIEQAPTGINILEVKNNKVKVKKIDDIGHLKGIKIIKEKDHII